VVTPARSGSQHGFVNRRLSRLHRALSERRDFAARRSRYRYGRTGTATTEALERALRSSKAAMRRVRCCRRAGGDFDGVAVGAACRRPSARHRHAYEPTRKFCEKYPRPLGSPPLIRSADRAASRPVPPNTRAVYVESPGSLSFELQDVSAIAQAAMPRAPSCSWTTPGRAVYYRASNTASIFRSRPAPSISAAIPM